MQIHYITAGGLRLRLPSQGVCHSLKRSEEKKKDKKLLRQGAKSASVKSSISLKQYARNLL